MKNSQTRLMDLLAGWGEFLAGESEDVAEPKVADAVFDLYQKVGRIEHFTWADFTDAMNEIEDLANLGAK